MISGVFLKGRGKKLALELLMICLFQRWGRKRIVIGGLCKTAGISPLLLLLHPAGVHHQVLVPTFFFSCLLLLPVTSYIQASADTYQVYHYLRSRRPTPEIGLKLQQQPFVAMIVLAFLSYTIATHVKNQAIKVSWKKPTT